MTRLVRTAVLAVGVAAVSAVAMPARTAELPPALQSFGVSRPVSAFELSATGAAGFSLQPVTAAALGSGVPSAEAMHLTQFAGSTVVSPTLALDAGRGLDIGARFTSYDRKVSPFLTPVNAPYLSLANGGRYAGMTFVPAPNLRMRLGTSINSERLDRFRFDPIAPTGPLAMTYDASQTRSILGGVSWDVTSAIGVDFTAISSDRSGVPLGFANASQLASRAQTNAFSVSAYADIGKGWVTTASFSEAMTQLNQRGSQPMLREQSYSLAIAKHGLFDSTDTLGFAFTRPAPSMAGSFSSLIGSGELPPLIISQTPALNMGRGQAAETDFSVGYVTNFLDGAVALQTNAAYQTNAHGQRGATAVSLLSRAKIKF
jgi:hypothetical protein